jgi:hypothetical protein
MALTTEERPKRTRHTRVMGEASMGSKLSVRGTMPKDGRHTANPYSASHLGRGSSAYPGNAWLHSEQEPYQYRTKEGNEVQVYVDSGMISTSGITGRADATSKG